jgi:hypothetical protein
MKKYVLLGLVAGAALSAFLIYLKRKQDQGFEFKGFFDSSTVADDLFGDAFLEAPDKI